MVAVFIRQNSKLIALRDLSASSMPSDMKVNLLCKLIVQDISSICCEIYIWQQENAVCDSWKGHVTGEVKQSAAANNMIQVPVGKGCTMLAQLRRARGFVAASRVLRALAWGPGCPLHPF